MRKISLLILSLSLLVSLSTFADKAPMLLNKVIYQFTAQEWVSTNSANITVAVDATLSGKNIADVREEILDKLKSLGPKGTEWHITNFTRNEDQSGLANLHMDALARINDDQVTAVLEKVKSISKPGAKFRIVSTDFSPGLDAMQAARTKLRATIYQDIQAELDRLNKVFSKQHYFVNQINFSPMQQPMLMAGIGGPRALDGQNMQVSQQITMTANVELASTIE